MNLNEFKAQSVRIVFLYCSSHIQLYKGKWVKSWIYPVCGLAKQVQKEKRQGISGQMIRMCDLRI